MASRSPRAPCSRFAFCALCRERADDICTLFAQIVHRSSRLQDGEEGEYRAVGNNDDEDDEEMLQAVDMPPAALDAERCSGENPASNLDLLCELENPPTQTNGNSQDTASKLLDLLD